MKSDNELRNLFTSDSLSCRGCGRIIWLAPTTPDITIRFREITHAYYMHRKSCFALKRLIVLESRNKKATDL